VAEKFKITARERDAKEKTNALRREGFIPAVVYGKGKESMPLAVDAHSFDLCYREAGGNSIVAVDIKKLDGGDSKKNALIYDVASDPVTDKVVHVDFLQIRMDEKITASIPLKFTGDSIAVIEQGGSLLTHLDEIEVECLPNDMPHEIEIDIAPLVDFEAVIHVSDIKIPEGVVVLTDPEEVVVYVEEPRSEEEMAELEEPVTPEEELPPSEHGEEETTEEAGEGEETAKKE
jgi:large subunit ribosomal protein L25